MRLQQIPLGAMLIFAAIYLLGPAAEAQAQQVGVDSAIEAAAEALQRDPVYVDPAADPGLSASEAEQLRRRIAAAGAGPIYVAILSESARSQAGGSTSEAVRMIGQAMQRRGTYVVVIGRELRAASTNFPAGVVPRIANETVQAQRGSGLAAVLLDFVNRVDRAAEGAGGSSGGPATGIGEPQSPSSGRDRSSGFGLLPLLLFGGIGLAAFFALNSNRKNQQVEERMRVEEVHKVAFADLVALGEDLRQLDLQVEMPDADPRAKEDYVKALNLYAKASENLDEADRLDEMEAVSAALEEGRYYLASAKARLEGREPPERRPPCFFDPRHGPSVRDVEWAPPGGYPRAVPACAADALAVEEGKEPASREIEAEGRRRPYWDAPAYYGPWAGGYFGGGGLFQGLLLGSLFSNFGGFWGGHSHHHDYGGGGGFDGGFGGGGFGGGDFGGGFGGGDFGGGGFGGGDFGGGDF